MVSAIVPLHFIVSKMNTPSRVETYFMIFLFFSPARAKPSSSQGREPLEINLSKSSPVRGDRLFGFVKMSLQPKNSDRHIGFLVQF